ECMAAVGGIRDVHFVYACTKRQPAESGAADGAGAGGEGGAGRGGGGSDGAGGADGGEGEEGGDSTGSEGEAVVAGA
ncbi:hypothetical protein MNEG_7370, partial [Monoraphidium neglectum]